jgi:hypothetical protein
MGHRNVDIMLSRPGVYVVSTVVAMGFVEVDEDGRCFQLELRSGTYQRDGELRPGGWIIQTIESIDGPFARTAHTALAV